LCCVGIDRENVKEANRLENAGYLVIGDRYYSPMADELFSRRW